MTQIPLFPTPIGVEPQVPLARVWIVGVPDELMVGRSLPPQVVRVGSDLAIRYVAESELRAAGAEPSFWICPIAPGAPDRRVLFETLDNEVVEQDTRGQIWIDNELVLPRTLVSFGSADREREGDLVPGECAALLLTERQPGGWAVRVRVTTPIVWLFELPRPLARGPVLDGWLQMAARARRESRSA